MTIVYKTIIYRLDRAISELKEDDTNERHKFVKYKKIMYIVTKLDTFIDHVYIKKDNGKHDYNIIINNVKDLTNVVITNYVPDTYNYNNFIANVKDFMLPNKISDYDYEEDEINACIKDNICLNI